MKVVLEFRHSHSVRIHVCCFGEIIAVPELLRFCYDFDTYRKGFPVRGDFNYHCKLGLLGMDSTLFTAAELYFLSVSRQCQGFLFIPLLP